MYYAYCIYVVFCFVSDVGAGCARGHMPLFFGGKKSSKRWNFSMEPNIIIKSRGKRVYLKPKCLCKIS